MFGWIESYLRQIAGKHAPNLPDCITCIYAQVHLQPDVIATEIKDPTKTNKIGNGKGVIELQVRVRNYRSSTREFHNLWIHENRDQREQELRCLAPSRERSRGNREHNF